MCTEALGDGIQASQNLSSVEPIDLTCVEPRLVVLDGLLWIADWIPGERRTVAKELTHGGIARDQLLTVCRVDLAP